MSIFDDDFYSTKVSRRVRWKQKEKTQPSFGMRVGRGWTPLRIAFMSSFVSAMAAVLLFSALFGFSGSGGDHGHTSVAAPIQVADPYERPIQAAAKIRPAVVSIINEQVLGSGWDGFGWDEQGEEDSDNTDDLPADDEGLHQAGLGSGVIFEKVGGKARIITNYHVVENAVSVKAVLVNGEVREATIIGKDQITDLAVLEIDAKGIDIVADIGDSTQLRDGETVIAIGNPLGLGDSLTMGIVSKTRRVIPVSLNQDGIYDWEQEVIQIDASINQGNSGGALVDLNGRLIGINSMKVAEYGVEGLGFAIPMHNAMPVVQSLIEYGKVKRPYIGVFTLDLEQYFAQRSMTQSPEDKKAEEEGIEDDLKLPKEVKAGVIVLEAVGPALKAGLEFNDVIVQLDEQPIGSTMELRKYLYTNKEIGDKIEVTYYRNGKKETTSLTLGEVTDED
ncbi:S1C family serine protease [Paenibacillus abyssi]|uniref:Serine protease n=1 Tax=Paenibacillus abyssi TaxID=1340531 RepID=A0A917CMV3_9BACL|nr:trypsin-like peptidase domain-containing protein [Paenibacillus abyssi]GGF93990.1 serine protease [Paenibacillus abyssi]